MSEKLQSFWENLLFYGPAFGSILIVFTGALIGIIFWILIKKIKKNVDKEEKKY